MIKKMKYLTHASMWVMDEAGSRWPLADNRVSKYNRECERHGYVKMLITSFEDQEYYDQDYYDTSYDIYKVLKFIDEQYILEHEVFPEVAEYDMNTDNIECFKVLDGEYDFDDLLDVDRWIQETKQGLWEDLSDDLDTVCRLYASDNPFSGVTLGDLINEGMPRISIEIDGEDIEFMYELVHELNIYTRPKYTDVLRDNYEDIENIILLSLRIDATNKYIDSLSAESWSNGYAETQQRDYDRMLSRYNLAIESIKHTASR